MKKIEINFEDMYYILSAAESQLKNWIPAFNDESDKITLKKIQRMKKELLKSSCKNYTIIEDD